MIKNIILLEDVEQNDFYNPEKSYNGGGYHQPLVKYSFEYNGENYILTYNSTSCGDFGSRYYVRISRTKDNKTIYDFDVDRINNREDELYFSDEFDVSFFFNLLDSELKEYIDFSSYDEILDFHIVDYCDYFDDDED
jgi:hypothetical protein